MNLRRKAPFAIAAAVTAFLVFGQAAGAATTCYPYRQATQSFAVKGVTYQNPMRTVATSASTVGSTYYQSSPAGAGQVAMGPAQSVSTSTRSYQTTSTYPSSPWVVYSQTNGPLVQSGYSSPAWSSYVGSGGMVYGTRQVSAGFGPAYTSYSYDSSTQYLWSSTPGSRVYYDYISYGNFLDCGNRNEATGYPLGCGGMSSVVTWNDHTNIYSGTRWVGHYNMYDRWMTGSYMTSTTYTVSDRLFGTEYYVAYPTYSASVSYNSYMDTVTTATRYPVADYSSRIVSTRPELASYTLQANESFTGNPYNVEAGYVAVNANTGELTVSGTRTATLGSFRTAVTTSTKPFGAGFNVNIDYTATPGPLVFSGSTVYAASAPGSGWAIDPSLGSRLCTTRPT